MRNLDNKWGMLNGYTNWSFTYTTISERISNRKTKSRERIAQIKLYTLEGKTQSEIAKLMGVSQSTISKWIRKSEEEGTWLKNEDTEKNIQLTEKEVLMEYIKKRKTIPDIAILMDTTNDVVIRMMKRYDLFNTYNELHPSQEKKHRSLKKRAKGKKASNKQPKKPADETGKQSRAEKVSTTRESEKEARKNAITDYLREILNNQSNREEKTRQIRDNFGKISSKEETLANLRKEEHNSESLDDKEGPIV